VEASQVGDRTVLYHPGSRTSVVLNPTGSWIWDWLETPRSEADLAGTLRARVPALTDAQARQDVGVFVAEMLDSRMLESRD
jgi:hypothetical protein